MDVKFILPVELTTHDSNTRLRTLHCSDVHICALFPNIVILVIVGITMQDFHTIAQHCRQLRELCAYVTSGVLAVETAKLIVSHWQHIEYVGITNERMGVAVTPDALHQLITKCVRLRKLTMLSEYNNVLKTKKCSCIIPYTLHRF